MDRLSNIVNYLTEIHLNMEYSVAYRHHSVVLVGRPPLMLTSQLPSEANRSESQCFCLYSAEHVSSNTALIPRMYSSSNSSNISGWCKVPSLPSLAPPAPRTHLAYKGLHTHDRLYPRYHEHSSSSYDDHHGHASADAGRDHHSRTTDAAVYSASSLTFRFGARFISE
jgi:hypothetical protein